MNLIQRAPALGLTLSVMCLALLSGCASIEQPHLQPYQTTPTPPSDTQAQNKLPLPGALPASPEHTAPSQPQSSVAPSASDKEGLAQADEREGVDAVGPATDALKPGLTITLSNAPSEDLWARIRSGFAMPDIDNALVHEHEQWYAGRPDYVQRMSERANKYLYHVVEEIEQRNMPTEIALLPFIESAFNPHAMSGARASGMWQFIPSTGKNFALKQNIFRDDRRDVLASTRAALDYLQRLHDMFGDWQLALAAYNWGEGNVQRAIAHNQRLGLPTDYLSLNMPPETAHYLPKLQAVKNIVLRPDQFGLSLAPIPNHPYFVSVPLKRDIDVALAARLANLDLESFHALNPSLNKPVILAAGTPQVLLPFDNATSFVDGLNQYRGRLASWTAWVVPKTMKPSHAAKEWGVTESELRSMNRIPPKMLIKAGSTLLVPRAVSKTADVSETLADNATMSLAPDLPPLRKISVRAGRHESVVSLARRYHLSASQVAAWNHLASNARIPRGQHIALYVPVKSRALGSHRYAQASMRHAGAAKRVTRLARSGSGHRHGLARNRSVALANER